MKILISWRPYIAAFFSVLLIATIEDVLHAPIDDKSRFLILLIPVAMAAWLGGRGPGMLGLGLSCIVGAFLYLPPKYSFLVEKPSDLVSLILFAAVSAVLIEIIDGLRRSQTSLAISEARVTDLNADLSKSLAVAEAALRRQKQFTSDASHELKTPLTAIRARAGIALSAPSDPAELLEHLAAVSRTSDVMISIVQDLLLLSASDEGQLKFKKEDAHLGTLIEDALASVDTNQHLIDVQVDPAITCNCDPSAITRLIVNLLQNAIQYTPSGKKISVHLEEQRDYIALQIEDEGIGIPPDHLKDVFNRFHRVDRSRDRDSGGTGLGLAIAKAIVDGHQGKIQIDSRVELGTTVIVQLPRSPSPGLS